jgi:hypothetical protein
MPRHPSGLTTRTHRVRPSEKTACRAIFGSAPVRPSGLRLAIPRRGGLRTPAEEGIAPTTRSPPFWPPVSRQLVGRDDMPRFASAPFLRARRPRPSEKITFRVISGPSPLGDPRCASPCRGGAGSARPRGGHWLDQGISISSTFHGTIWTKRSAGNIMSRARDRTPNRLRKRIPQ